MFGGWSKVYKDKMLNMEIHIRLASIIIVLLVLLSVGTVTYRQLEKWSWVDSLYFTTTTLTTIGLGDLHPTSDVSKLFTVVFVLVGVSFVLFSLTLVADAYFKYGHIRFENQVRTMGNRIQEKRRPWRSSWLPWKKRKGYKKV